MRFAVASASFTDNFGEMERHGRGRQRERRKIRRLALKFVEIISGLV